MKYCTLNQYCSLSDHKKMNKIFDKFDYMISFVLKAYIISKFVTPTERAVLYFL